MDLGFFCDLPFWLISTRSEAQVSPWSQECCSYCVSSSCINYFKNLLPLKKPQAIFVFIIDIWIGFIVWCIVWKICDINWHKNSLFWWCTFMYFFLLESRTNFRFSAWWIFIFSWRVFFTISLQIGYHCAVGYRCTSENG